MEDSKVRLRSIMNGDEDVDTACNNEKGGRNGGIIGIRRRE